MLVVLWSHLVPRSFFQILVLSKLLHWTSPDHVYSVHVHLCYDLSQLVSLIQGAYIPGTNSDFLLLLLLSKCWLPTGFGRQLSLVKLLCLLQLSDVKVGISSARCLSFGIILCPESFITPGPVQIASLNLP